MKINVKVIPAGKKMGGLFSVGRRHAAPHSDRRGHRPLHNSDSSSSTSAWRIRRVNGTQNSSQLFSNISMRVTIAPMPVLSSVQRTGLTLMPRRGGVELFRPPDGSFPKLLSHYHIEKISSTPLWPAGLSGRRDFFAPSKVIFVSFGAAGGSASGRFIPTPCPSRRR